MNCLQITLWHASTHDFNTFDFNQVGTTSLRHGYGFYFSRTKAQAQGHVPNAKFLYKISLSRSEYKNLLRLSEQLQNQQKNITGLAVTLSPTPPMDKWTRLYANNGLIGSGKSLYQAACNYAGPNSTGIQH